MTNPVEIEVLRIKHLFEEATKEHWSDTILYMDLYRIIENIIDIQFNRGYEEGRHEANEW